jgi:hypothetical protein
MGKITKGAALPAQREQLARIAYADSRGTFEQWAAMDAPMLPPDAVDAAQVGLARWQADRFANVPTSDAIMALGVIEELGETFDSHDDPEGAIDGLGDTCVYASQLCTANRLAVRPVIALAQIYAATNSGAGQLSPIHAAGQLAHIVVKHTQAIRGLGPAEAYGPRLVDALALIIAKAFEDCTFVHDLRIEVPGVFTTIAREVMQRKQGDAMIPTAAPVPVDQHHSQGVDLVEARNKALEQLATGADMATAALETEPGDFTVTQRKARDVLEGKPRTFDVSDVLNHTGICPQCSASMSYDGSKQSYECTNGHEITREQLAALQP